MKYIPYQKCPKCDAQGVVNVFSYSTTGTISMNACDVCHGQKIIPMYEKELNIQSTIDSKCSKCGNGEMNWDGMVLTSNPPKYAHKCNKCGNVEYRDNR